MEDIPLRLEGAPMEHNGLHLVGDVTQPSQTSRDFIPPRHLSRCLSRIHRRHSLVRYGNLTLPDFEEHRQLCHPVFPPEHRGERVQLFDARGPEGTEAIRELIEKVSRIDCLLSHPALIDMLCGVLGRRGPWPLHLIGEVFDLLHHHRPLVKRGAFVEVRLVELPPWARACVDRTEPRLALAVDVRPVNWSFSYYSDWRNRWAPMQVKNAKHFLVLALWARTR